MLRGALAAVWLNAGRPVDDDFVSLFERDVMFGPCTPVGTNVLPASTSRCKRKPDPACVGVVDENLTANHLCPHCEGPLEPNKGQLVDEFGDRPEMCSVTSTAIGDDGTAEDGNLFSRDGLERDTKLSGVLRVGSLSQAAKTWLTKQCVVFLGGRRSVAGKATIAISPIEISGSPPELRTDPHQVLVVALSPLILVSDDGRPTLTPTSQMLNQAAGTDAASESEWTVERQWVRTGSVGGWHARSGLAKPRDLVAERGSAYLLRCSSELTTDVLTGMERRGLGLRRIEGFGAIAVNPAVPTIRPKPAQTQDSAAHQLIEKDLETLAEWMSARDRRWIGRQLNNRRRLAEINVQARSVANDKRFRSAHANARKAVEALESTADKNPVAGDLASRILLEAR